MSRAVLAATVVAALVAGFFFGAGIEPASAQGQGAQAPADSRMKRIADTKTVKIAYRAAAAPFSFLDPNKQPVGYTIDLCKGVVESMGRALGGELKIEWVQVTTQNRFEAVASGQADMECGSSTVSLGRMREVDFSSIIFVESTGMVVKAASGITEGAGLAGKRIAVAANTSNERALADLVKQGKLTATLVPVKDREEGIAALEKGSVDAYASDKLLLVGARFTDSKAVTMLPDDFSLEPYGIVLPRGDWALRLAVNTGLAEIFRSGRVVGIFRTWFDQIGLRPGALLLAAYNLGALPE
jgi:ABC-type amino acid transport substrate-binding protein